MSDFLQMMDAAATTLVANVAFGLLVLGSFAVLICGALFGSLLVRGVWRFLTRRTWGDVVASSHRKALR